MSSNAAFTGNIPEVYDQGLGPVIFVDYADVVARRAADLAPERVLETAAGTGIVTRRLRDRLPANAQLTATDLNPPMLDIARGKCSPAEAVEFLPADATALPFGDARFDAVVCQFGIMFFPDRAESFREVHRVLEPGGVYLFSVWDSHRHNPFARLTQAIVEEAFPDDPPRFYHVPFSCSAIDPIKEALIEAGFRDIRIDVVRIDKAIADLSAFAHALIHGNPLSEQIRERGVEPDLLATTLLDRLRQEFGDPGRMPLQAIFYSARKPVAAG